jgi:hypothetical protein
MRDTMFHVTIYEVYLFHHDKNSGDRLSDVICGRVSMSKNMMDDRKKFPMSHFCVTYTL